MHPSSPGEPLALGQDYRPRIEHRNLCSFSIRDLTSSSRLLVCSLWLEIMAIPQVGAGEGEDWTRLCSKHRISGSFCPTRRVGRGGRQR